MTLLAPGFLIAAGFVAVGIVALHLVSTREPKSSMLPTVRFVPDVPVVAKTLTFRFSDRRLLMLRALLVLLLGLALSRPLLTSFRSEVVRIVAVDVSRAVGSFALLRDSAQSRVTQASTVIFFDHEAREVEAATDSLELLTEGSGWTDGRGSLSSALIKALRAASKLRDGADSLELTIISPFVREEHDAATEHIRSLWPGRIELVRVAARGAADGPGSLGLTGNPEGGGVPRVEWADSGTMLWSEREPPDTVGGARAGAAVMIYPFERRWQPAPGLMPLPDGGYLTGNEERLRVHARWIDGEPAVFERSTSDGCLRISAVSLPAEGDVVLRTDFVRFQEGLLAPCGEPMDLTPLSSDLMTKLAGDGALAPADDFPRQFKASTPAVPWILALALILALGELRARRRWVRKSPANNEGDIGE